MNNISLWAQIVIALIGSGLAGGIAGIISSKITSNQKIRELEIVYHQKVNDIYLENARQFKETLYMPINISLSKLANKYRYFENCKKSWEDMERICKTSWPPSDAETKVSYERMLVRTKGELRKVRNATNEFRKACDEYIELMDETTNQGQDAYLTIQFEECLRSLTEYLKKVKDMPDYADMAEAKGEAERFLNADYISFIGSKAFTTQFNSDINFLKSCIKEVTLGKGVENKLLS